MKSKLMDEVMDAVGELPDFGNLLLREGGFPHLPAPTMSQFANKADYEAAIKSQSDAWHYAGTAPSISGVYETRTSENQKTRMFQHWNGVFWGAYTDTPKHASLSSIASKISATQFVQWREVQP